jgi:hypothetical protein
VTRPSYFRQRCARRRGTSSNRALLPALNCISSTVRYCRRSAVIHQPCVLTGVQPYFINRALLPALNCISSTVRYCRHSAVFRQNRVLLLALDRNLAKHLLSPRSLLLH